MPTECESVFAEASGGDDAEFDRLLVHDTFEALLERQERGMDRVFEREFVVVPAPRRGISRKLSPEGGGQDRPLFEERLCIDLVLANGGGFPGPERAGGVDLVKRVALGLVVAGDKE